jgi:hypothetical protein
MSAERYGFRTGLAPVPFVGDLKRAKVFLLMLNPGYYPCYEVDEVVNGPASWKNIMHEGDQTFWPLADVPIQNDFNRYWRRLMRPVADILGSYEPMLDRLAMCNLVPYRSPHFKYEGLFDAESSALMQSFVREELSKREDPLVIVARRPRIWRYPYKEQEHGYLWEQCMMIRRCIRPEDRGTIRHGPERDVIRFEGVECRGILLHKHAARIAERLIS